MMKRVTAAIIVHNGKVLITKRKSTDRFPDKWEFPGGSIEDGETPEECLKREIKEELDIDVDVDEFIGESVYPYEHVTVSLLGYRAIWKNGDIVLNVHADYQWSSPNQLLNYDFLQADLPFVEKIIKGEIDS